MKESTVSDKVFVERQHRFRGLASDFKSRGFVKDRTAPPSRQFRAGLRELLLNARADLHPSQFDAFLVWTNQQMAAQLPELARFPVGYEELTGVLAHAPAVTLEREFLWIAARVKAEASRLNAFRSAAEIVENLVFSGNIEEAIDALKLIERSFGATLWAVQLRIALEHQAGGLERQKRYTAEVRSVYKRGLLGFVTYHTSVLNEDKTTLGKFIDDIKGRIEQHQYFQDSVKTYARYRLAGEWPSTENGLADILRVEQSHSSIDVYETFIAVVQEIARREDLVEARSVVARCLRALSLVTDFRLTKVAQLLEECTVYRRLEDRGTEISDALFAGNVKLAVRAARRVHRTSTGVDPWQMIYAGFAFGHTTMTRAGQVRRPQDVACLIGRIQSRLSTVDDSLAQLGKLATSIRGLPTAAGLLDMLQQLQRSRPDDPWRPWLIGMNSRTSGVEDISPSNWACREFEFRLRAGPTKTAWKGFLGVKSEPVNSENAGVALLTAAGLLRNGDNLKATDLLATQYADNGPQPLRSILTLLLLHSYFSLGDRKNVIALIGNEGARDEVNRLSLPVVRTIEHYSWTDYKAVSVPLAALIALHLLWIENESDKIASLLRFATGVFLKSSGAERPSKLFDHAGRYPRHQLVYFLQVICVPQILDVSRVVRSTREVMEERQAICATLRLLDPENASNYEAEVMSISNQLALDEGQWIVDRTRIHVDTDALSRWAAKELSEDYARYRDLLSVDIGVGQNFDDVLKELATAAHSQRATFTPKDEADAVLVSILRRLGEEFLNNPSFGLDFYLSQRIRHQSFIGLIRGPLEFANLITTRESESGQYHRNTFWLDKFKCSGTETIEALNEAFARCAANFDDTLIAAKDKSFHVQSQEKPTGLLFLNLTTQLVTFARAIVRMDANLPDFINTAVALLWAALESSLSQVRNFISEDLKTKITEGFDELRATVSGLAEQDPGFLEFDMEIGGRSTEVQHALDDAARWFTRADIEAHKRLFTLKQVVKIAIDSALKSQRAFDPEICSVVENDLQMTGSSLVFVHDVLFVALDNVRAHSGVKKPKVNVKVQPNIEEGTLTIEVTSEAKVQNRAIKDKELRDIRQLIDGGVVDRRTRREGGSGFVKLAAVVSQSVKGKIDFGFLDSSQFQLAVTYSLVMQVLD